MNKERLLKLANHLEFGVLGHISFNFSRLNEGSIINEKTLCKTNGCAIGECPIAFPEDWEFRQFGASIGEYIEVIPSLKVYSRDNTIVSSSVSPSFRSAELFFDIDEKESEILFIPSNYANQNERNNSIEDDDYTSDEELYFNERVILRQFNDATAKQIANHIRYFVELKES